MSSQVKHNRYQHQIVEPKWQAQWKKSGIDVADLDNSKPPFYNLMMFPYPSAEGLHVGNMYAFVGTDIFGRYKRMQGYNVFEPIGLDGFGIHSENYALKVGKHPIEQAKRSQENFYRQLSVTGCMFDWTRTVETYDPTYYAWTQWLFVQMFRNGLAYRGKADVNWCPSCKTVLADEQVIDGKCERCGNLVEKRLLEQWFFRITAYAGKLLENISSLKWSQKVLIAQKNWIGKKEGINITYQVVDEVGKDFGSVTCFTTRPDTNFGATFVVMAPEHPFVSQLLSVIKNKQTDVMLQYIETTKKQSQQDRIAAGRKKTGAFTGLYCINQLTGRKMPLYISDFVVMGVGTGVVVGVPAHDKRDFEFSSVFNLPVIRVVASDADDIREIKTIDDVQEESGHMINSEFLDGHDIHEATTMMMDHLEKKGWGKRVTTYHLRDWLISRQRYWGPPIPMIYCDTCAKANQGERKDMAGWYTVKDESLPVLLPNIADYKPGDDGVAPLAKHKEFYETTCPSCGSVANRETDVSDTFLDSSWYFLRYPSVGSSTAKTAPFDPAITKKWLPVSMYTGGAEHSVLHLMYSRFVTMALKDWGFINFEEPFPNFFAHGLVIKDGAKMSKSKGNVINPDEYIKLYGTDALRLYLMFMGPFAEGGDFRDASMEGMARWVGRVWRISIASLQLSSDAVDSDIVTKSLHKMLKKVGDDTEMRHYNTAIASMMEFTNVVNEATGTLSHKALRMLLIVLAPYAPHLTEEIWSMLGGTDSVHAQLWPTYDSEQIKDDQIPFVVQVNGKTRGTITVDVTVGHDQVAVEALVRKNENIARHLSGKEVRKVIFVPSKIINFVVS
jgi:leucyl-tRNA synthetase